MSNHDAPETISFEEQYQTVLIYFVRSLLILAMEPDAQCHANGNYNTSQELQYEILAGRYVLGKGKLDPPEEHAIADLAAAVATLPKEALTFAEGHAADVRIMKHPAWAPIRSKAAFTLALLADRIAENQKYFETNGDGSHGR